MYTASIEEEETNKFKQGLEFLKHRKQVQEYYDETVLYLTLNKNNIPSNSHKIYSDEEKYFKELLNK
jgi:hypothetical protein